MKNAHLWRLVAATLASVALTLVALWQLAPQVLVGVKSDGAFVPVARRVPIKSQSARAIVDASKAQIGTRYDASFALLSYPNGDVPPDRGACTDVIVRSLRAVGVDLQARIHRDMKARFASYPQKWGERAPNPSIDHRRVPNQMKYLQRHAQVLTRRADPGTWAQWQPGDIVYWNSGGGRLHTGIISDGVAADGEPFVIHNGSVCIEDHALRRWPIIGHFRVRG
jgi:uncharacterized protein YijF (DUF1287 family)